MKRNYLIVAICLVSAVAGCKWEDRLYKTYVHENERMVKCPPGVVNGSNDDVLFEYDTLLCYQSRIVFKVTEDQKTLDASLETITYNQMYNNRDKCENIQSSESLENDNSPLLLSAIDGVSYLNNCSKPTKLLWEEYSKCFDKNNKCDKTSSNLPYICKYCDDYSSDFISCLDMQVHNSSFINIESSANTLTFINSENNSSSTSNLEDYPEITFGVPVGSSENFSYCPTDYPYCVFNAESNSYGCVNKQKTSNGCDYYKVYKDGWCITPMNNNKYCGIQKLENQRTDDTNSSAKGVKSCGNGSRCSESYCECIGANYFKNSDLDSEIICQNMEYNNQHCGVMGSGETGFGTTCQSDQVCLAGQCISNPCKDDEIFCPDTPKGRCVTAEEGCAISCGPLQLNCMLEAGVKSARCITGKNKYGMDEYKCEATSCNDEFELSNGICRLKSDIVYCDNTRCEDILPYALYYSCTKPANKCQISQRSENTSDKMCATGTFKVENYIDMRLGSTASYSKIKNELGENAKDNTFVLPTGREDDEHVFHSTEYTICNQVDCECQMREGNNKEIVVVNNDDGTNTNAKSNCLLYKYMSCEPDENSCTNLTSLDDTSILCNKIEGNEDGTIATCINHTCHCNDEDSYLITESISPTESVGQCVKKSELKYPCIQNTSASNIDYNNSIINDEQKPVYCDRIKHPDNTEMQCVNNTCKCPDGYTICPTNDFYYKYECKETCENPLSCSALSTDKDKRNCSKVRGENVECKFDVCVCEPGQAVVKLESPDGDYTHECWAPAIATQPDPPNPPDPPVDGLFPNCLELSISSEGGEVKECGKVKLLAGAENVTCSEGNECVCADGYHLCRFGKEDAYEYACCPNDLNKLTCADLSSGSGESCDYVTTGSDAGATCEAEKCHCPDDMFVVEQPDHTGFYCEGAAG